VGFTLILLIRKGLPLRRGASDTRTSRAGRQVFLAVVAACWLAGTASAASVGGGPAQAAHHCKCAEKCRGAACCCGKADRVLAPAPAPSENKEPAPAGADRIIDAGPCVSCAPCGGEGLPGPAPGWTNARLAALGPVVLTPAPAHVSRLTENSATPCPSSLSSRLDDPPEARPAS
jgi:hypothetical protein